MPSPNPLPASPASGRGGLKNQHSLLISFAINIFDKRTLMSIRSEFSILWALPLGRGWRGALLLLFHQLHRISHDHLRL
jgi:hypothetical protein